MTGARPLIGITACNRPFGEEAAQVVIDRYMEAAMLHADVAALLIPAKPDLMDAREAAARIDGLLLTGSPSNIEPERYGDADGKGPFDPARDEMSLALIAAMLDAGKPVFGICRGFQEINVAFGGTLDRGLGDAGRALPHHAPNGLPLDAMFAHSHDVSLSPGGVLARGLGCDRLTVNSVHFQGVRQLGKGLSVEATAPDGVIEAVSARPGGTPVLAIQWHPEWQTDRNAASMGFFGIMGRVLRGEALAPDPAREGV